MLLVDIIALQRSFPTFPVKVILIEPEGLGQPHVADIMEPAEEEPEA
jgi:hypothetical protein